MQSGLNEGLAGNKRGRDNTKIQAQTPTVPGFFEPRFQPSVNPPGPTKLVKIDPAPAPYQSSLLMMGGNIEEVNCSAFREYSSGAPQA